MDSPGNVVADMCGAVYRGAEDIRAIEDDPIVSIKTFCVWNRLLFPFDVCSESLIFRANSSLADKCVYLFMSLTSEDV